ncbi:MAG: type III-B CRISPR module RAMP protein Cmr6 [Marinospirillum sp.]|uniref:type III-B CRISPR module RAMP protein Cmr6 n=1 Tax=Marinospirillum sp. TaxID=2183934 RepID=UPI0019F70662|nr:type III-B CRISPR module RAMP protein Cmr6 [Marinospirillum sp.]MBE0508532.1 type III-B CRISPR module RAMP protein Cmr6 [Marinospirillum sp.]
MLPLYQYETHPIPSGAGELRNLELQGAHSGLWFERFFNQYNAEYKVEADAKKIFLESLTGHLGQGRCGADARLKAAYFRQKSLVQACQGRSLLLHSEGHFATGLGNPHPIENGFLFHPTLAVPYLPGSGVKGLVRSWLERQLGQDEGAKNLFHRLFGSDDKDPKEVIEETGTGEIIFFDALPFKPIELLLDTMTPHAGGWYQKGGGAEAREAANQPADWHDPNPVCFLAARNCLLHFSFAPRVQQGDTAQLLQLVAKALEQALTHAGAGAKTGAGYGSFRCLSDKEQEEVTRLDRQQETALAEQQEAQKLAQLSPQAQRVEALRKLSELPQNQNAGSGAGFFSQLTATLEEGVDWAKADKQALYQLGKAYQRHVSKKKEKDYKALLNALGVDSA